MTPRPAEYEVQRRPTWDPEPGDECIWRCLRERPLCLHRLSDRVLGALYIAIELDLIRKSDCDPSETDLAASFKIRATRYSANLGSALFTPDRKAVVAINVPAGKSVITFKLQGDDDVALGLPSVTFDLSLFRTTYAMFDDWVDSNLYARDQKGGYNIVTFSDYPKIDVDTAPSDWPAGLTRDRQQASEAWYNQNSLDPVTGEQARELLAVRKRKRTQAAASDPKDKDKGLERLTWWFGLEIEPASSATPSELANMKIVFLHWLLHDSTLTDKEKARTLAESADPGVLKSAFAKAESVERLFYDAIDLYSTDRHIRGDLDQLRPPAPELNFEVTPGTPLSAFNLPLRRTRQALPRPQLSSSATSQLSQF